jgi:hypothetical protein
MTLYLDRKYISLVSSSLEKFKWKKMNLANCRCPICGDSDSDKKKARGYFFSANNAYFYKCHNCGVSLNVYKFLEMVSPTLFQQYSLEKFTDKENKVEEIEKPVIRKTRTTTFKCDNIYALPENHKAIDFLVSRKIPKDKWNRFNFTERFGTFAKGVNSDYDLQEEERIVIPIYDEHNQFIGAQGRSFGNSQPKYITLKKDEDIKLVYGLNVIDKSKQVFVVEGPIDSMFLPNAIACLGVGNFLEIRKLFPNLDLVFVVDNEPRNRSVTTTLRKLIENNEKVCIFPDSIKEKDINDMVLQGFDVCDIIGKHVYRGASAMLAYNAWRKCT